MTPAQCRAARALLDWSVERLADAAESPAGAVAAYEGGLPEHPADLPDRLATALYAAGVVLVAEDDRGAGVRFAKPSGPISEGIRPEDLNSSNDD